MKGKSKLIFIFILIFTDCFASFYSDKLIISHDRIKRSSKSTSFDHPQDSGKSFLKHKASHLESVQEPPYVATIHPDSVATTHLDSHDTSSSTEDEGKLSTDQIYDSSEIVSDIRDKPLGKSAEKYANEEILLPKQRIFYPPQPKGYQQEMTPPPHKLDDENDDCKENEANPSNEYNVPEGNRNRFSLPSLPSQGGKHNWSNQKLTGSATTLQKSNKEHNHSYLKVFDNPDSERGYETSPTGYESPTSSFKSSELSYMSPPFSLEKSKVTYEIPEYIEKEASINYIGREDSNPPPSVYEKPKKSYELSTEVPQFHEITDQIYKPSSHKLEQEQTSKNSFTLYKKPNESYDDPNPYSQFSDNPEKNVKSHPILPPIYESPIEYEVPNQSYEAPILFSPTHEKPWESYNHPKYSFQNSATTTKNYHKFTRVHTPDYHSVPISAEKPELLLKGEKLKYDPQPKFLVHEQKYQHPGISHEIYTTPHEKHEELPPVDDPLKHPPENYKHSIKEGRGHDKTSVTLSRIEPMFKSSHEISVLQPPSSPHRLPAQYSVSTVSHKTPEEAYLDGSNEYKETKFSNFAAVNFSKHVVLKENNEDNSPEINQSYEIELPVEYKIPRDFKDEPQLDYGSPTEKSILSPLFYKSLGHATKEAPVQSLNYESPKLEQHEMNSAATRIGYDTDIRSLLKDFTREQQPIIIVDSRRSRRPFYSPPILPHRVLDPYDDGFRTSGRHRRPFVRRRRPWYRRRFRPRFYRSTRAGAALVMEK